jgi:hypothetical protein
MAGTALPRPALTKAARGAEQRTFSMIRQQQHGGHSDLAPSSKDWQPGSPGRDEDFTPDKDYWTLNRQAHQEAGDPGEDINSGDGSNSSPVSDGDIQPGTARPGRTWQSNRPHSEDEALDGAVEDTFPASDPPALTQPGSTGWDLEDHYRAEGHRFAMNPHPQYNGGAFSRAPRWLWVAALGLAVLPIIYSAATARRRR